MIDNVFPNKPTSNINLTDEEWIKYCVDVWCCNSLNARAGALRYSDPQTSALLYRAQDVIMYLENKIKW